MNNCGNGALDMLFKTFTSFSHPGLKSLNDEKMFFRIDRLLALMLCINSIQLIASEEVRFSNLYQDGMVLQKRPESATIWGYGVIPIGTTAEFQCILDGALFEFTESLIMIQNEIWMMEISPQEASTSCNINIMVSNQILTLENVLFGDVYLCSGQSNMGFRMIDVFNASEEIEYSQRYQDIRYTWVRNTSSLDSDDTMDIDLAINWSSPKQTFQMTLR